ncbi:ABC transporter ATP-binding protein, partial [Acinetobacter baumannii]
IFRPLRVIADKFNILQMGMIAAERVFKVLDNDDIPIDNIAKQENIVFKGAIDFEKVWFGYTTENEVLKDISFHIEPGETVAIVGHTG